MSTPVRPTKKQHQTLEFIRAFIKQHGYSPSYREIMRGCDYASVATVALHVNSLIKRGHIIKRDKSARSLEVVTGSTTGAAAKADKADHKQTLMQEVESRFESLEKELKQEILDEVYVLTGALKILGHHEVAKEYAVRINDFKQS